MGFQIAQTLFWSALAAWFGSVLFVIAAAPVVLRTVRESNPILTDVLSVNLEGQHASLLGGTIVGRVFARLLRVEMACAGIVLFALILQFFLASLSHGEGWMAVARSLLFAAAVGVALLDSLVYTPRVNRNRAEYIAHADEPDVANPALDRFDAAGRQSLMLLFARAGLLFGVILFSATVTPRPTGVSYAAPAGPG